MFVACQQDLEKILIEKLFITGKQRVLSDEISSKSSRISASYLEHLLEKLKCSSTRESTKKKYHEVWTKFNKFVISLDIKPTTWERRLALYCAYLVEKGIQSNTIKSYISAIKKVLKDDGYDWKDNMALLDSLTKACRLLNDRVKTHLPIQIGLLELILFQLNRKFSTQIYLLQLYKALFALAYYGLMRISELTFSNLATHYVRAKDLHVGRNKDKILLVLYTSKTHGRESRPQEIKIEASEDQSKTSRHFCLFKLMRQYMSLRGDYDDDNEPLFMFQGSVCITPVHVRSVLRECLDKLNLDSKLYDTHSFRVGMATDMVKRKFLISEICQKGCWKSNVVYKYIRST